MPPPHKRPGKSAIVGQGRIRTALKIPKIISKMPEETRRIIKELQDMRPFENMPDELRVIKAELHNMQTLSRITSQNIKQRIDYILMKYVEYFSKEISNHSPKGRGILIYRLRKYNHELFVPLIADSLKWDSSSNVRRIAARVLREMSQNKPLLETCIRKELPDKVLSAKIAEDLKDTPCRWEMVKLHKLLYS